GLPRSLAGRADWPPTPLTPRPAGRMIRLAGGRSRRLRSMLREVIETAALIVLIMVVVNIAVDRTHVEGPSMQPALHSGQFLLTNKPAYSSFASRVFAVDDPAATPELPGTPHRSDIVILRYPGDRQINFVKRVIGLPGETIEVRDGTVWLNEAPL